MRRLFDTSVLVAAMVAAHPAHERSVRCFEHALSDDGELLVCTHSLAELYAVLTRLPVSPRISPGSARRLIRENLEVDPVRLVPLEASDYLAVLDRMTEFGFPGGVIYDALILHTACRAEVDEVVTLNESDFVRLSFGLSVRIVAP